MWSGDKGDCTESKFGLGVQNYQEMLREALSQTFIFVHRVCPCLPVFAFTFCSLIDIIDVGIFGY